MNNLIKRLPPRYCKAGKYITIACAVLISLNFPFAGFILSVAGMSAILTRKLVFTGFTSFVMSIYICFVGNIIIYTLVTLLGLHLPVQYTWTLLAFIVAVLLIVFFHKRENRSTPFEMFNRSDLLALAVSSIIFIVLMIPTYSLTGARIAQFLSFGEDNASHYALTKYIYEKGQFAYRTAPDHNGLANSLEIYPQGYHLNAAAFIALASPAHVSKQAFVKAYYVFIALNYALLMFWFSKLITAPKRTVPWQIDIAALPAYTLLPGLSIFLLLLDRGFQPQVFAYGFLLAVIFAFAQNNSDKQNNLILPLTATLSVGIAASWWLLIPIPFVLVLQYLIRHKLSPSLFREELQYLPVYLLSLLALLYPIVVNVLLSQKHSPLNEPGGVDKLSWSIFWYVAPVCVGLLVVIRKRIGNYGAILTSIVASVVLAIAIGAYQKLTVGHFEYYFYKSIYTIVLLALILFYKSGIEATSLLYQAFKKLRYVLPVLILLATIFIGIASNLVYVKVYTHNWFPNSVPPEDLKVLFEPNTDSYKDILFLGSCDGARNYLENRWSGARLQSEGNLHSKLEVDTMHNAANQAGAQAKKIVTSPGRYMLVVYKDCASHVSNLEQLKQKPNVTVRIME